MLKAGCATLSRPTGSTGYGLEGAADLSPTHVAEAIQYRTMDRKF